MKRLIGAAALAVLAASGPITLGVASTAPPGSATMVDPKDTPPEKNPG